MILQQKVKVLTRKNKTSILNTVVICCPKCKIELCEVYRPRFIKVKCQKCKAMYEFDTMK